jgi:hypothetical protein
MNISNARLKKYAEIMAATGNRHKAIEAAMKEPGYVDIIEVKKAAYKSGMFLDVERLHDGKAKKQLLFT